MDIVFPPITRKHALRHCPDSREKAENYQNAVRDQNCLCAKKETMESVDQYQTSSTFSELDCVLNACYLVRKEIVWACSQIFNTAPTHPNTQTLSVVRSELIGENGVPGDSVWRSICGTGATQRVRFSMMHFSDKGGPRIDQSPKGPKSTHQKLALAFCCHEGKASDDMKESAKRWDAIVANHDKRWHPVFKKQQGHDIPWLAALEEDKVNTEFALLANWLFSVL